MLHTNLAYLTYLAENTVSGTSVGISKSAKLLIFHLNQFVCSMNECVLLFQTAFTSTNRGKGEIHGFLFQIIQIVSLKSELH